MGLRTVTFDIVHKLNTSPITKANTLTDKYKRKVVATGKATDNWVRKNNAANSSLNKITRTLATFVSFAVIKSGIETVIERTAQLEENTSKFETVFGSLSEEADKWSRQYSDVVGRSVVETQKFLAESQNMLVGFGATRAEGFELSKQIQTLAVDLASFNNVADADSLTRLQSGLLGNHEAVRNLGIVLTENVLNLKAQEVGFRQNFSELDPLTKIQIRYAVAVSQSQDAIGDAERTAGSFTNQLKRLQGRFFDLTSQGGPLIESMQRLINVINENFDSIAKFIDFGINVAAVAIEKFAAVIEFTSEQGEYLLPIVTSLVATFTALKVVTTVSTAMSIYNAVVTGMIPIQTAANVQVGTFNALMLANPIGIVIAVIGLLIGAIILLTQNWEEVTGAVQEFFRVTKDVFSKLEPPEWFANLISGGQDALIEAAEATYAADGSPITGGTGATSGIGGAGAAGGQIPGFARGTMYAPGGLSLINESPGSGEIVELNRGDKVYSRARSATMKKSGGNMPVTINIYPGQNQNAKDIAREVQREIDKYWRNMATAEGVVTR